MLEAGHGGVAGAPIGVAGLFAGKTVVVSGAGSGLGKAIACLFARLGANVAICGRNEEKLAAATAFLQGTGAKIFSRPMTIRDPEQAGTGDDRPDGAKDKERREAGIPTRSEYDNERSRVKAENVSEALRLRASGLFVPQIAKTMGVAERTIKRWLKEG